MFAAVLLGHEQCDERMVELTALLHSGDSRASLPPTTLGR